MHGLLPHLLQNTVCGCFLGQKLSKHANTRQGTTRQRAAMTCVGNAEGCPPHQRPTNRFVPSSNCLLTGFPTAGNRFLQPFLKSPL